MRGSVSDLQTGLRQGAERRKVRVSTHLLSIFGSAFFQFLLDEPRPVRVATELRDVSVDILNLVLAKSTLRAHVS